MFACPHCRGSLIETQSRDTIVCERCKESFPIRDGIPIFSRDPSYYWGELTQELMTELVERTRQVGWDRAFDEMAPRMPTDWREYLEHYAQDERRAAWKYLLQMPPGGSVLDCGCGWGNLAYSLAQSFSRVFAMDLTYLRTAVTALRAQSMGLANVLPVVGGDRKHFPFPDAALDAVVLNGVLEWMPYSHDGDPRDIQIQILKDIRRILKPDGQIYIGIENRLDFKYFINRPDPHTKLRYVTLLPRPVANWYCRVVNKQPFRAYTYTWRGYRKMLREAGFSDVKFYTPHPNYREFSRLVDLSTAGSVGRALEPISTKGRIARAIFSRVNIFRELCAGYGIIASKSPKPVSWLDRLLTRVSAMVSSDGLRANRIVISKRGALLAFASPATNHTELAIRIPVSNWCRRHHEHFCSRLRSVYALPQLNDELRAVIPEPLGDGDFEGTAFSVQRAMHGEKALNYLARSDTRHLEAALRAATGFIAKFHRATLRWPSQSPELQHIPSVDYLRLICERLPSITQQVMGEIGDAYHRLLGKDRPQVCTHGDFFLENLLYDERLDRITGVLDWENSEPGGLPLLDLLHLMASTEHERANMPLNKAYLSVLNALGNSTLHAQLLKNYTLEVPLPRAILESCLLLGWPHFVWRKLSSGDEQYEQFLPAMAEDLRQAKECVARIPREIADGN